MRHKSEAVRAQVGFIYRTNEDAIVQAAGTALPRPPPLDEMDAAAIDAQYQQFQRMLQMQGLQGFWYEIDGKKDSHRVWAGVGDTDVWFSDDGDKKDKYIFVYGSANKKAAKRAAKLMIMTKFLHLLCTGIVVPPFA